MLSKFLLLITFSSVAFGQSQSGQAIIPSTPSITVDPTYSSGYLSLVQNVTSLTFPDGLYASNPYHLTVCQGSSGPYTIAGWSSNVSGILSLKTSGCTFYRMVWDAVDSTWITSVMGQPGPVGPQGVQGATGPTGATGVIGPAGSSGPAGPAGSAGATGSQGIQGANGPPGASATVMLGTVTTLACSATPTVTNSGTTTAAVLNFSIPGCADLIGTGIVPSATLLAAGCSTSVVISVPGAVVGHRVDVMVASGALPAGNTYLTGSVTSTGNVTALQCATVALTLPALSVRVSVGS